ncbi:hypothetical protein [Sorangium sp. So ce1335]|uniref:hypothetical protein n=1 Tax=Sorangium sp. So ce1335 TaxID=3133335 RepID=UPI003F5F248C
MKMTDVRAASCVVLPAGRLLYKPSDELRYVVVHRGRAGEFWLVEDGWTAESIAAGPFRPEDILRAFRLANTLVPEGCELGPWQTGIGLFKPAKLPSHPGDWSRVEAAWLAPSVSRYSDSDIRKPINEICCAPPQDPPRVEWKAADTPETHEPPDLVYELCQESRLKEVGTLRRPWNAHPPGSPLLAESKELNGIFVVIDLPPA